MEQLKLYQVGFSEFKQHFELVGESTNIAFGDFLVMRNVQSGDEVLVKPQETSSLEETEALLNTISDINIRLNSSEGFVQFLGFTEVPPDERQNSNPQQSPDVDQNLIYLVFEYFPHDIETLWPQLIAQHPIEELLKSLAVTISGCFNTLELIGQSHTDVSLKNILVANNNNNQQQPNGLPRFKLVYSQYTTSAFRQIIDLEQDQQNYFLAPEIREKIENKLRSSSGLDPEKIDVYAFGLMLLLLASQKSDTVSMQAKSTLQDERVVQRLLEIVKSQYSAEFLSLLNSMLDQQNSRRPSFQIISFILSTISIGSVNPSTLLQHSQTKSSKSTIHQQTLPNGMITQSRSQMSPQLSNQLKELEKLPLQYRAQEIRNELFSSKRQSAANPIRRDRSHSSSHAASKCLPTGSRYTTTTSYTPNRLTSQQINKRAGAQQATTTPLSLGRSTFSPVSHSPYERRAFNMQNNQVTSQTSKAMFRSELATSSTNASPSRYSSNHQISIVGESFKKEYIERMLQDIERTVLFDENGQMKPGMVRKDYQDGSVFIGQLAGDSEMREGQGIYYYKNLDGNILRSELVETPFAELYAGGWMSNLFEGDGRYIFATGERYIGELKGGQKDGHGTYFYANGNEYTGEWVDDLKHGAGIFNFQVIGERYEGKFVKGHRHGDGTYVFKNGDIYIGEWVFGEKAGRGEVRFADGSHFEGEWKTNQPNGTGKMIYRNGDEYEGVFIGGLKEGSGTYFHRSAGSKYEGSFKSDEPQGYGRFAYSNLDSFEGDVKSGQRHGNGVYTYANGDRFEGEWKFDKKHGNGVFTFSDGSVYQGGWANGQIKGQGQMEYGNGDSYRGEWLKDKKHGKGFYRWGSGNSYKGDWRNDRMNGKGVFVSANGQTYSGMWHENKLVTKI